MSDLNIRALGLLTFVSIEEGFNDPPSMLGCFTEADCALRVLRKVLHKEDQLKFGQLVLLELFEFSFASFAENQVDKSVFDEILEKIAFVKTLFVD